MFFVNISGKNHSILGTMPNGTFYSSGTIFVAAAPDVTPPQRISNQIKKTLSGRRASKRP